MSGPPLALALRGIDDGEVPRRASGDGADENAAPVRARWPLS